MVFGADSELLLWDASENPPRLNVRGNWTLENYAALGEQIALLRHRSGGLAAARRNVDLGELAGLDTAGAARLYELLGAELAGELAASDAALSRERRALLLMVANAMGAAGKVSQRRQRGAFIEIFGHAGVALEIFRQQILALLGFMGFTLDALARGLLHPERWRLTSIVAQIHETGLNAVPIIGLLNFMVGAVIAFLGATVLANFGASIYTVNLVTFAFLRELGVLLTAILMAGRTASTFTAQLGSMKINEEIDATRVLGLNPVNLLVLPRVLALFVSLPILTFVGMISGILGGALVCALQLDISLAMFLTIFHDQIELRHFLVGMSKAPVFAFVIGVVGCLEGLKVSGSALSVGQHTTASVVHSIFVVIFLDAVAALFFMEMGW
ncbi:phospholipid/cholesterol/gamma-HCH transport system permease protein [Nitrosospira multiformis]|uniref:Phospholipid/cholesterol/gamma-HCH transport system permease protein n=1 Tax=Nitrosospira multiformis TaxID=1231 RepID=A0A1I0FVT0_9PROT|nr:ABC transporter permease [Nitrosospira multiformis]SET62441.1 phospholipid/cholesterol/gamma-HCH transport system permease protein [Nitrosospira multiformis]